MRKGLIAALIGLGLSSSSVFAANNGPTICVAGDAFGAGQVVYLNGGRFSGGIPCPNGGLCQDSIGVTNITSITFNSGINNTPEVTAQLGTDFEASTTGYTAELRQPYETTSTLCVAGACLVIKPGMKACAGG